MEDTRKFPIQANETLVAVVCSARIKRQYLRESSFFGTPMTNEYMLEELADDEIVAVLRVNTDTWKPEDITEYCARQYLYSRDHDGTLEVTEDYDVSDLEKTFPNYVRNSTAWANWRHDLEMERPIDPEPRRYNSLRPVRGASLDMEAAR